MSPQQMADYYAVLGVQRDATVEVIRKAYKKRALQYHPDRPGGDEQRFREVNEAYEVLSDTDKRAIYDRHGKEGLQQQQQQGGGFDFAGMDPFRVFREMFSDMDGNVPGQPTQRNIQRAHDIFFDLQISHTDLFNGCTKKLAVQHKRFCKLCSGNGVVPPEGEELPDLQCMQCQGSGKQTMVQRTFMGERTQHVPCSFCSGEGIKAPLSLPKCPTCKGSRLVSERAIFEARVEAGAPDGWQLVCPEQGDQSLLAGEGVGDVVLRVRSPPLPDGWSRRGPHLIHTLDVTLADCVLGVQRTVQHPRGTSLRFVIEQVVRPSVVGPDGALLAPWIVDEGGLPAWRDQPQGWLVLALRVQWPELRVDPADPVSALGAATTAADKDGQVVMCRPPANDAERARLRQWLGGGGGPSVQAGPQVFAMPGGATFFQFHARPPQ